MVANVTKRTAQPTAPAPKGWKVSTAGKSMDILSRQWISRPADERYLSLEDLVRATKARADQTEEIRTENHKIEIFSPAAKRPSKDRDTLLAQNQQLMFGLPSGKEVTPTNWAFGQLAALASAPPAYLRTLPGPLVADNVQYGLRYNRGKEEIKLFADDIEAMAITGPDYGRIFNYEVAEAVSMATSGQTGDNRWKIPGMLDWSTMKYDPNHPVTKDTTTLFANDRGVFIFLCQDLAPIEIGKLRDGSPDLVFRGFYVTNSEVGAGALKLGAMYLRAICCNRILWGVEAFEELVMRHTKYAPSRFIEEARPALESFANGSQKKLVDGVRQAKEAVVAKSRDEALDWLSERNVSRRRAMAVYDAILKEERGIDLNDNAAVESMMTMPITAWEVAQGMTAVARDERNFDMRFDLEKDAGKILDKVA